MLNPESASSGDKLSYGNCITVIVYIIFSFRQSLPVVYATEELKKVMQQTDRQTAIHTHFSKTHAEA